MATEIDPSLDALLRRHEPVQANLMAVLHEVVHHYGYVPEEVIEPIADYLGITPPVVYDNGDFEQVMSSLLELKSGTVEVNGKQVRTGRPGAMLAAGVGVIPEDRHESGCVLDMTVAENLLYTDLDEVSSGLFVNRRKVRAKAEQLVREFDIMTPSTDIPMRSLSGGNQQRLVLARELARHPAVLIASQPTQGLDVGAIEYVTARLRAAAEAGVAVLLISTELEEILALSDRVAVIYRGQILGEMARDETDLERLGLMMGGHAA